MNDNKAKIELVAVDKTRAAFESAKRNLTDIRDVASRLNGVLALVGIAGAGGIAALAKSGIDAADALNDLSQRTGVSVKDLASLKLAADQADTSLEDVGKGVQRLTLSMGQAEAGDKARAESLKRLGITARDPKEAFFQLADAVKNSNDPLKTNAALNDVLGRSYANLLPLLQQGGDGLRDSAAASETFSDTMARLAPNAARFNDELDVLKQNAAGAAGALLQRLVPGLADTAERVRELLDEDKGVQALVRAFAGLGKLPWDLIFPDIKMAATAKDRIAELKTELGGLEADLRKSETGGSRSSVLLRKMFGTPEELQQQVTLVRNQIDALEKFGDKVYKPKPAAAASATPAGLDLSAASVATTKNLNLSALAAEDLARNLKMAADEQERMADDAAFMREVDEAQSNAVAGMAQEWIEAGRALQAEVITPLESFEARLEYINELWRRGVIDIDTYNRAIEGAFDENLPALEQTKSLAEEIGLTFTSAFEDAVAGGKSFSDVLKALEQDLIKLLVRKTVTEPLFKAIEGIDFGSIFSANANGNVYNSPGLSAYSGQIVDRPTVFPFASGIGLMGEAGAEAILPLKRGANGKLGVEGGGSSVQVNVINNASGTQATATERQDNGVRIIDVMVEQVEGAMSRRMSRGEGIAPAMERRYGLNPSAGAVR